MQLPLQDASEDGRRRQSLRFSIWPAAQQPFADVLTIARHAADTGWHGVWFADHFMPNAGMMSPATPVLEAGSVVAALAAVVPRVRIGTLVYGNTYRHPAVVANMAATVDRISDGRFTLGLGAGWQVNEHEQYGIPLPPTRELIDRFEEALQVVRGLLTEPTTSFTGEHYQLTDAVSEPKPVQRPLPILVGAGGEQRMLRIVAKYADAWNTWGLPELIAHKSAVLDQHCEKVGRDPATITRTAQALVFVGAAGAEQAANAPMPAFGGTAAQLTEVVAGYAALGLDELIIPTGPLGDAAAAVEAMELLRTEVFPHLT